MELEERFGVRLSEDAIARVNSLRDLLEEARQTAATAPEEVGRPSPEQERWLEPRSAFERALARTLLVLDGWLLRALFGVRVDGLEHLPRGRPYLLTPNHESYLDPVALCAVLPWEQLRHLYWAGWAGLLFRGPLTRLFSRVFQVLPVDPERGLTSTLTLGRAVLERGDPLVWFPEGGRSTDGRLQPFLPGSRAAAGAHGRARGAGVDRGHVRGVAAGAASAATASGQHPHRPAACAGQLWSLAAPKSSAIAASPSACAKRWQSWHPKSRRGTRGQPCDLTRRRCRTHVSRSEDAPCAGASPWWTFRSPT